MKGRGERQDTRDKGWKLFYPAVELACNIAGLKRGSN